MRVDALQPVFRQILAQAEKFPDKTAMVSAGQTISYAHLESSIAAAAAALRERCNVHAGDRVILLASSHCGFVYTYLAAHSIGAICVPLDPRIPAPRFAGIVERVLPQLVVSERPLPDIAAKTASFDALAEGVGPTPPADIGLNHTADILFTTGTTGQSKGVVVSHRALAAACSHINAFIQTAEDTMEVLPLPLSHSFGLGRVRCVLSLGGTLVLLPGLVGTAPILAAMTEFRATGFASVPAGIALFLNERGSAFERFANQLQYIEIGSSAMPMAHKRALMDALPKTRICMHYGLTEASRSAFLSFHDDADRLDSIGRPSPGVAMRIVDDNGNAVDDGTEGEIEVHGEHLMTGYWQDAALSQKTLRDGWMRTGDLGHRDAGGYFYLHARTSDMINVGGRKVSPLEIEEILITHPAVADCACVGVTDAQAISGEMISAFLVADPAYGSLPKFSELAKLLRRSLEPYKIPRRFTWINAIPKSPSGKVLRRELKATGGPD